MRTSIARANGCIRDKKDFNWIHNNNITFRATLAELAQAEYTFTILRCPFSRLASVYLDKFVSKDPVAWHFCDLLERKVAPKDVTFEMFVQSLAKPNVMHGNIHWRPQVDFLVYQDYDEYFCFEEFSAASEKIRKKLTMAMIDARPLTRHGTDKFTLIRTGNYSKTSPDEIYAIQMRGKCPAHNTLYNEALIEAVRKLYKDDIALYKSIFSETNLTFQ